MFVQPIHRKARLLLIGTLMTALFSAASMNVAAQTGTHQYDTLAVPIFGYDPTYGVILGGVLFDYPVDHPLIKSEGPKRYRSVQGAAAWGPFMQFGMEQRVEQFTPHWDYRVRAEFDNFFSPYYTQSDADYDKVERYRAGLEAELAHHLTSLASPALSAWQVATQLTAEQEYREDSGTDRRLYPTLYLRFDTRTPQLAPRQGQWFETALKVQPTALDTRSLDSTGWHLSNDLRHFFGVTARSSLAMRVTHEQADGNAFEVAVGGADRLRGYPSERFKGTTLVAGQLEWRYPLFGILDGVTFVEGGWLDSTEQSRTLGTAGSGLRMRLSPDGQYLLRLDLAASDRGDAQFYINFNQAF
ncbi:MAG: hypothetical protein JXQ97_08490 [Natronospirillum sp.]